MDAVDRLNEKAREYEVLAAWHAERAPIGAAGARGEHSASATAFVVVAIVLREVAGALEEAA